MKYREVVDDMMLVHLRTNAYRYWVYEIIDYMGIFISWHELIMEIE